MAGIVGPVVGTGLGKVYYDNRKKWNRPQAMVWANNPGEVVKSGAETGVTYPLGSEGTDFIVISDHGRSPINFDLIRLENRVRMVNGNMRSYHTADKVSLSANWTLLPSRAFAGQVSYDMAGDHHPSGGCEYTADGGVGGVDMLSWWRNTTGPFWVFLSYDNYENYVDESGTPGANQFGMIRDYGERHLMYFTSFNYTVEKRGLYDFWNISVNLEEA